MSAAWTAGLRDREPPSRAALHWWRHLDRRWLAHDLARLVEYVERGYYGPWPEGEPDLNLGALHAYGPDVLGRAVPHRYVRSSR